MWIWYNIKSTIWAFENNFNRRLPRTFTGWIRPMNSVWGRLYSLFTWLLKYREEKPKDEVPIRHTTHVPVLPFVTRMMRVPKENSRETHQWNNFLHIAFSRLGMRCFLVATIRHITPGTLLRKISASTIPTNKLGMKKKKMILSMLKHVTKI